MSLCAFIEPVSGLELLIDVQAFRGNAGLPFTCFIDNESKRDDILIKEVLHVRLILNDLLIPSNKETMHLRSRVKENKVI